MNANNAQYYLDKVKEFRDAAGLVQNTEQHRKLFEEESNEYKTAVTKQDKADALADQIVVRAGWVIDCPKDAGDWLTFVRNTEHLALLNDINLKAAFDLVHESNMSKFCLECEISGTAEKYAAIGVTVYFEAIQDGLHSCFSGLDHGGELSDFFKGKLLKSISYKEPDFEGSSAWLINPTT